MSTHEGKSKSYDSRGRWRTETYAHSSEVGGINDTLYIVGDEFTDGSVRLIFNASDTTIANIESRVDGVWNDTGFRFASSSVSLGRDLQIGAVGGFVESLNFSEVVLHLKALIPHIRFNDLGTTQAAHMPILDVREDFVVFAGPATGEVIGTTIGQIFSAIPTRVLFTATHLVGSVSATEDIQVSYYKGIDNTGPLINRFNLAPSKMPASSTLVITYDNDFGFQNAENIFLEFVSAANISLETNVGGDVIYTQNGHTLAELDIIMDELLLTNDLSMVFDNNLGFVVHNRF